MDPLKPKSKQGPYSLVIITANDGDESRNRHKGKLVGVVPGLRRTGSPFFSTHTS